MVEWEINESKGKNKSEIKRASGHELYTSKFKKVSKERQKTKGKAHEKGTKEKSTDMSENFRWNKHAPFLASPNLHRAGSAGRRQNV